jgi:hypothetical protein
MKTKAMKPALPDSPVEKRRKELPRGDGSWAGFGQVYTLISNACQKMAETKYIYLSDEHVEAMAVLGCGHEETMKAQLWHLRDRGFAEYTL